MRVHLRFLKKDPDLCKWRHSVSGKMLSFYLNSILSAELHNRIAFIPQTVLLSMDESPCDISFHTSSREIEAFVASIPSNQRNKVIKEIIRKHLRSQGVIKSRTVNPFSEEVQMAPDKPIPKRAKVEFVPEKQSMSVLPPPPLYGQTSRNRKRTVTVRRPMRNENCAWR